MRILMKRTLEKTLSNEAIAKKFKDGNFLKENKFEFKKVEETYGIKLYLNNFKEGFAILKQNYFDFIVNEIDIDNKVVELTDTKIEFLKRVEKDDNPLEVLKELYSQDIIDQISTFISSSKGELLLPAESEKEKRSKIHGFFKKNYKFIESDTFQGQIRLRFKKDVKDEPIRNTWPQGVGSYLEFVLVKKNLDNHNVINELSHAIGVKNKVFAWAGTKDKKAITTQKLTAYKTLMEKFHKITIPNVEFGNFRYVNEQIKLGDLKGNRFTLVLRQVEDVTKENIEFITKNGFINYFGLQRFGNNTEIPTYQIGIYLLQGNMEKSVKTFLISQGNEIFDELLTQYYNKNIGIEELYQRTPRYLKTERDVLHNYITKGETDHYNAFQAIGRNLRAIYLHSYQSLIWNKITSLRIEKYGLNVVVGDLVSQEILEDKAKPILVTEDNIKDFTIYDVVLPTPGTDVIFPKHEFNQKFYEDMMKNDEIELKMFENLVKTYMCYGTYRRILERGDNINYKFVKYEDDDTPLVSDQGKILEEKQGENLKDGLIIQFNLKSSSYATMFIRELLHFPSN